MHAPPSGLMKSQNVPYRFPELVQAKTRSQPPPAQHGNADSALETVCTRSRLSLQPYTQNARIGNWIACEPFWPENPALRQTEAACEGDLQHTGGTWSRIKISDPRANMVELILGHFGENGQRQGATSNAFRHREASLG